MVRWLATLKVVGSPFHDSALTEYVGHGLRIVWWVWLGGTQNHFWFKHFRLRSEGRGWWLGTLLGPEKTPVGCFFGAASWSGCPNAS